MEPSAPAVAPPVDKPAPPKPPVTKPPVEKVPAKDGSTLGDPVSRAGLAGQAVDSNANVRLLLHMAVVREHPQGRRVGALLERTPQWSDFFGATGVNALEDVDHVLVAGPQLRDSSNVVAVVQHHLSATQVEAAFERLVARGGQWVERTPAIVKARADRADRLFVAPNARVVAIVPPSAEKSARSLSKKVGFPSGGDVALEAYVVTPWRVARGTGLKIPDSIRWARFEVLPESRGGAIVRIEAEDASADEATVNAAHLERAVRAASTLDLGSGVLGGLASLAFGSSKQRFIEQIQFTAKDKLIQGRLEVTAKQLATLLDLLDAVLPPPRPRQRFDELPPQDAPAAGTPSGTVSPDAAPAAPPSQSTSTAPSSEGAPAKVDPAPAAEPAPPRDPPPPEPNPAPDAP